MAFFQQPTAHSAGAAHAAIMGGFPFIEMGVGCKLMGVNIEDPVDLLSFLAEDPELSILALSEVGRAAKANGCQFDATADGDVIEKAQSYFRLLAGEAQSTQFERRRFVA